MVDIKSLVFYIRLKITWNWEKQTIKLLQPDYIKKLLNCYGIRKVKTVKVLIQDTILLLFNMLISELEKAKYSTKFGLIIYAIVETYINITFTTSMVSRFAKNFSLEHFHTIDQILYYLARSQDKSIIFGGKEELKLIGYSDLGWAENHANWKSISGFIFRLNRRSVSYTFKKQIVVTLSSTKAKYIILNLAIQETIWL